MIKVRILTGITAATAAVVAVPTLTGCAADTDEEALSVGEDELRSIAGSGEFVVNGWSNVYRSTSGGDEFIRVGEKMKASVSLDSIVYLIAYGDDALQAALRADPSKLKLEYAPKYTRANGSTFDGAREAITWKTGTDGRTYGTSKEQAVPNKIKHVKVELIATFDRAGETETVNVLNSVGLRQDFTVFGAFLPNKLALFDTNHSKARTRVVEGGKLIPGADALISISDYRLDTLVDKMSLDLRVGRKMEGGRFGPIEIDALGRLEYEVGAVYSTDGGATYQPLGLAKVSGAAAINGERNRFTFEKGLNVPNNAKGELKIAFHVQAFLQVPDGNGIKDMKYAPNSRVLLKDVWDNNGGANFSVPVGRN